MFRVIVERPPSGEWVTLMDDQIRKSLKVANDLLNFYNTHANTFEWDAG